MHFIPHISAMHKQPVTGNPVIHLMEDVHPLRSPVRSSPGGLDPYIIDHIRRKEEQKREQSREQPRAPELPEYDPGKTRLPEEGPEKSERGVVIIPYGEPSDGSTRRVPGGVILQF